MKLLIGSLLLLSQTTIRYHPDAVKHVVTTNSKLATAADSSQVLLLLQLGHERLQGRYRKKPVLNRNEREAAAKETLEEPEEGQPDEKSEEPDKNEGPVAVALAATLLASITFILMFLHLMHHSDEDIRFAAYDVISTTSSIFCAVLVFQAVNELLDFVCPSSPSWQVGLSVLQVLVWHCLAELTLGYFTGIFKEHPAGTSRAEVHCQTKCYAVLLAHITGFAAIYAIGRIQQNFLNDTPLISALAVVVAFIFLRALQEISERLRHWYKVNPESEWTHLWEVETEEAENDVMCFAVSFTLIQSVRFGIGGVLPNVEGEELPITYLHHSKEEAWLLLGLGMAFIITTLLAYYFLRAMGRFTVEFVTSMAMCFAWCTFYGTQWLIGATRPLAFNHDYVLLSVLTAILCSVVAFAMIFFIHFLIQLNHSIDTDDLDEALRKLYRVMGLLIGFAWETTFDDAETAVADIMEYRQAGRILLAVVSVGVLAPAWRWYVLPMVHQGGWKFGFVTEHLIEHVQQYDEDASKHVKRAMVSLYSVHLNEEKQKYAKRRQRKHKRRGNLRADSRQSVRRAATMASVEESSVTATTPFGNQIPAVVRMTRQSSDSGDDNENALQRLGHGEAQRGMKTCATDYFRRSASPEEDDDEEEKA